MTGIKKRRKYTSEFRANVALDALRNELTIDQISENYSVHRNQVLGWKRHVVKMLATLFDDYHIPRNHLQYKRLLAAAHKDRERIRIERDWLARRLPSSAKGRKKLMDMDAKCISVSRQCELLAIRRSSAYYKKKDDK